jgi:photosystem II stability/assembly factor-like uncharacterized protein
MKKNILKKSVIAVILFFAVNSSFSQSWFRLQSNTGNHLFGIDFVSENLGITAGQNGIIKATSNGGLTWNSQMSGTDRALTRLI